MWESDLMTSLTTWLFFFGVHYHVYGQECTWAPLEPTVYIRASGAPATLNVSVSGEQLTTADRVTWKLNETDLSVRRYSSSGALEETLSNPRGTPSSSTGSHSITIRSVTLSDNGQQVTVISGGCTVNDVSPPITLQVECCNASYFHPASSNDTACCGFNCRREFVYPNRSVLNARCQEDATWTWEAASQCSWTIAKSQSAVGDDEIFRIAKGAPAQFTFSVTGENMKDKHQILWTATTLELNRQFYNATTGEFEEITNRKDYLNGTYSSEPGNYSVTIPAIDFPAIFPDVVGIIVESDGCPAIPESSPLFIQVLCCNMSVLDSASSNDTSCCGYKCVREFKDPSGSIMKATCQENATWAYEALTRTEGVTTTVSLNSSHTTTNSTNVDNGILDGPQWWFILAIVLAIVILLVCIVAIIHWCVCGDQGKTVAND